MRGKKDGPRRLSSPIAILTNIMLKLASTLRPVRLGITSLPVLRVSYSGYSPSLAGLTADQAEARPILSAAVNLY